MPRSCVLARQVKVLCQFKGREMEFKQIALDLFNKFAGDLKDDGSLEVKPTIEGRSMIMIIIPTKVVAGAGGGGDAKPKTPKPAPAAAAASPAPSAAAPAAPVPAAAE